MPAMLHEILAVEKTRSASAKALLEETSMKFGKEHFFQGWEKSLSMLNESPENGATEQAARESRALPTTVYDTLDYALSIWAEAEDIIFQKNLTNTTAKADIVLTDGYVLARNVPVDELLGLEVRLVEIRNMLLRMPTINAAVEWVKDENLGKHVFKTKNPALTSKTEKRMFPVVLHEATKEHPAQVKESSKDEVVGTFKRIDWSGAATAIQKSDSIKRIDDLISAVKSARMRANSVEVLPGAIGKVLIDYLLEPLKV